MQNTITTIRTADGLHLSGTLVLPDNVRQVAVLVHDGCVPREEGGFFTRLAAGLADAGIGSLRCDLRGHGESEGCQEDLTIAGILGDLRATIAFARSRIGAERVALLGTSFSGGICGYYATQHPTELASLGMLNPLLNYKNLLARWVHQRESRAGTATSELPCPLADIQAWSTTLERGFLPPATHGAR
jgi:uncharacterized protein